MTRRRGKYQGLLRVLCKLKTSAWSLEDSYHYNHTVSQWNGIITQYVSIYCFDKAHLPSNSKFCYTEALCVSGWTADCSRSADSHTDLTRLLFVGGYSMPVLLNGINGREHADWYTKCLYSDLMAALSHASGVSTAGRLSVSRSTASSTSSSANETEAGQPDTGPLWFWLFLALLRRTMVRDPCSETRTTLGTMNTSYFTIRYVTTAAEPFYYYGKWNCPNNCTEFG